MSRGRWGSLPTEEDWGELRCAKLFCVQRTQRVGCCAGFTGLLNQVAELESNRSSTGDTFILITWIPSAITFTVPLDKGTPHRIVHLLLPEDCLKGNPVRGFLTNI